MGDETIQSFRKKRWCNAGVLKVYIQRSEWELSSTSKGPKSLLLQNMLITLYNNST